MVYSAFGSNRPLVLSFLILPALIIAFFITADSQVPIYELSGPAFDLIFNALESFMVIRVILGMALILGNAILLNRLYNVHDLAASENYFPALVFVTLAFMDFQNIDLHPVLFSNLFLLLALRRLLLVYRATTVLSIGFDSATFLAISVLFFPPSVLVMPLVWVVFGQMRPFALKEWLVPFAAMIMVALYVFAYYYLADLSFFPFEYFAWDRKWFSSSLSSWSIVLIILVVIIAMLSFLGMGSFVAEIGKSTLRKKNTKYTFLWLVLLLVLQYLYVSLLQARDQGVWLILALPVSVFLGAFFSKVDRRRKLKVASFYIWLVTSVVFMIFSN